MEPLFLATYPTNMFAESENAKCTFYFCKVKLRKNLFESLFIFDDWAKVL